VTALGFVGLGHMGGNRAVRFLREMLTLARAAGYEHRDIAALYEVLAQLTGDTARPPA
jgi:hypothetical protein